MARMSNEGSNGSYSGDPEVDAVTARVRMALNESNARASKPRSKASDTSRMNPVYKPKASPGPAANTLNLYGAAKPRLGGNANAREDRKPKPKVPASAKTLNKYGAAKPRLGGNANARENRKPQGRNTGRGD
jgi:hypothetical protein